MAGTPNKRASGKTVTPQRPGQPVVVLPTQHHSDWNVTIMQSERTANVRLPAYGDAHPQYQDYKVANIQPISTNETDVCYTITYRKDEGHALEGEVVSGGTWGAHGETTNQRVPPGTPADDGFNVVESTVTSEDGQTSYKATTTVNPWPSLTSRRVNDRGDVETTTTTKQRPDDTLPTDTLLTTQIAQTPDNKDRVEQRVSAVPSHSTLTDKNRGAQELARFAKDGRFDVKDDVVSPSTDPDADDPLEDHRTISSVVRGRTKTKSQRRTTITESFETLKAVDMMDGAALGERTERTTRPVLKGDTPPAPAFGVLEAKVTPLNDTHAIETVRKLPSGVTAFPVIEGSYVDPISGIRFLTKKTIIQTGSKNAGIVDGYYEEIQPVDKYHSTLVATKADPSSLPAPQTLPIFLNVDLPTILLGVEVDFFGATTKTQEVKGKGAAAGVNASASGAIIPKLQDGWSGPAEGERTETYTIGPPVAALPSPTPIITTSGIAYIKLRWENYSYSANPSGVSMRANSGTQISRMRINNVLTNSVAMTGNGNQTGGLSHVITDTASAGTGSATDPPITVNAVGTAYADAVIEIENSNPQVLTPGTWIVRQVVVEQMRYNVFKTTVIRFKVPNPNPSP